MVIEISLTSVGAVFLVVLLLLVLRCISDWRDKRAQRDHKGSRSTGTDDFICLYIRLHKFHRNIMMNVWDNYFTHG